jgi:hypothetical protein
MRSDNRLRLDQRSRESRELMQDSVGHLEGATQDSAASARAPQTRSGLVHTTSVCRMMAKNGLPVIHSCRRQMFVCDAAAKEIVRAYDPFAVQDRS